MKEFKETILRHCKSSNRTRVKHMADILRSLCIYSIVPDVFSNAERIQHISSILPVLMKFEKFEEHKKSLAEKASAIYEEAQKAVRTDSIGFKFSLAFNEMLSICNKGGIDKTVLLECVDITISVLQAKRTKLEKLLSTEPVEHKHEVTKRRKTELQGSPDISDNFDSLEVCSNRII